MVRLGAVDRMIGEVPHANFNSNMVRLGECYFGALLPVQTYFNSNMVQLGASMNSRYNAFFVHFNSNMVQLGADNPITCPEVIPKFQFQYGTIRSGRTQISFLDASQFQFQYGTIRSYVITFSAKAFAYFNSNMVQLGASQHTAPLNLEFTFQFQYGTIRSQAEMAKEKLLKISIPIWYN